MPETTKPIFEDERINRLYAKMTGSRQKADGTITYYIDTAKRFLARLNKDTFDGTDIDEYFSWRRAKGGISERTLKKEFFALAKLWKANKTEPWP
ncbi:MAG: phage integrase N-terminal SAM-like domain-containing protein, partial [Phycisphaerae bacterium]